MDKNEIIGTLLAIFLIITGILGYNYIENKDGNVKATAGLEQCSKTPDWNNSGNIWVKDCAKYMQEWQKVQDN